MQTIKKKKLNKFIKKSKNSNNYINQTNNYLKLFNNFPEIKFLLNQILEADRLLKQNLLPQSLPKMILPDNIQDIIYRKISEKYPPGNSEGDKLWDQLTSQLLKLDKHLRNFRDYLENNYGMWAYISAPFGKQLSNYLQNKNVLEVMAGNGYISKALKQYNPLNKNYATDSKTWNKINATGNHPVTKIERLSALDAIDKYKNDVDSVIMSWAPDKEIDDYQVLEKIRNINARQHELDLIIIGEYKGATNSTKFWNNAVLENIEILSNKLSHFDLINDKVYLAK